MEYQRTPARPVWLLLVVATAAALPSQDPTGDLALLQWAPLHWQAREGTTGVTVEIVDATNGQPLADAVFSFVGNVAKQADGAWLVGRGKTWFEARAEGYLTRREAFEVPPPARGGSLRLPLLPHVVVLRGRIEPAVACTVDVGEGAAKLGELASVRCDDQGGFLALLAPGVESVTVTATAVGRTFATTVSTTATTRIPFGPMRDVPEVTWEGVLRAPPEASACIQKYGVRFDARAKTNLRPAKPWNRTIENGLAWLAAHQDEDGSFDAENFMRHDQTGTPCDGAGQWDCKVGVTGLALLAFLAEGHTATQGRYASNVARGARWLVAQRIQGNLLTTVKGDRHPRHYIYEHCLATEALCEAVGLGGLDDLRPLVQAAVDALCQHRNPYGAWRYDKQTGDNDMSVTCRAVLALTAARDFGFLVDGKAWEHAAAYAEDMTDANGRTGYAEKGGLSARLSKEHGNRFPWERTEAMTAAGLLMRWLAKPQADDPLRARSLSLLEKKPPVWDDRGSCDFYYWALGAHAVHALGDKEWKRSWSKALTAAIVKHQRTDGAFAGSFDPVGAWCEKGGRVYATAILLLALQAPTRFRS